MRFSRLIHQIVVPPSQRLMAIIVDNQNDQSPLEFARGPSELAVLKNAQNAFGSLPNDAPFDVLGSISAPMETTGTSKAKENSRHPARPSRNILATDEGQKKGEAAACELLMNLVRLTWVDKPLRTHIDPQGPARIQGHTDRAKIELIDRLRQKGNYEQAIAELADLLPDIDSTAFLGPLLRLSRDLGATQNVITHAQKELGTKAPAIETAGPDSLPGGNRIGRSAQSIERGIPYQFAGVAKGQEALQESVFKWVNTDQAPHGLANLVHRQAREGSTIARILIAEAAFQRGKYALAQKYFSSPDVRNLPITLVHRRLGELALMSGDSRLAATHFEVTLLIPSQEWQTARLPKGKTRRVGRLSDYYFIYWFDGRYMAVPQDRPIRGVTRLGGNAVRLFERKTTYDWDHKALAYAVEARRKIWQRLFPERNEAPTVIISQRRPISTRVFQVLLGIRYAIPGLSRVPLRKVAAPIIAPSRRVAKAIARQIPRPVIDALLQLKPALAWRPNPRATVRTAITKAKPHAFNGARYLYRSVAAPILIFILNGRVIPESLCADNLNDLVNKLPAIPQTTHKAGR